MSKWKKVKIRDIAMRKLEYGSGASAIEYNGRTRYIRITDINDIGILNNNLVSPSTEDEKYKLEDGDLLFARSGATVGKTFLYSKEHGNCIYAGYLIKLKSNQKIASPKFMYYFTKSPIYLAFIESNKRIVAQPNINAQQYGELEVPLPPLEIQKQIAKTLDSTSELLDMRKQQLAELDNLIKSTFYDMFGDPVANEKSWEVSTVDRVCSKIMGGGTPSKSYSDYYIGDIPWVTPKDMKTIWIKDSIDHISEDAINNCSAKLIPSNSVLMVIRSGILKKALPVAINIVVIAINQDMKAFITNEKIVAEYLLYFFILMQNNILKNVRAVTADNIEFSLIKNLIIPLPPLNFQIQFASIVTKIEEQKVLVKKAIDETQYLFDSLMSEYFE